MAKAEKTEKKTEGKKIGASAKDLGFKYGVTDLADKMGIEPASVRVALRNKGVPKNGSVYGWNSKADLEEVISKLQTKSSKTKDERKAPAKGDGEGKKSAAKPKATKSDEKVSSKKPAPKSNKKAAAAEAEGAAA